MYKKLLSIALLLTLVALSCTRQIDSKDPVRSLPDAGPTPFNVQAAINNGSVDLSWDITDPGAVAKYRIYTYDTASGGYIITDSSTTQTARVENLGANHTYEFAVASVSADGLEGHKSERVTVRMTHYAITISGDVEYTRFIDVAVQTTTLSTTTHMMLSEDPNFADASFETFSANKSFRLSVGDGVKTVYARLQFSDGSVTGDPLSDDIILDSQASIESVDFTPSGQNFGVGDTIYFTLDAGEPDGNAWLSFTGVQRVNLYDDGSHTDGTAGDGVYTGFWVVPTVFNLASGIVTGIFTDRAGNSAQSATAAEALNIFTPPLAVNLSALAISTSEITLDWTKSTSSNFSAYRIYRSNSEGVDENDLLVESITDIDSMSFTDSILTAGTEYFYRIYVFNNTGLFTGSNEVSATTLSPAPTGSTDLPTTDVTGAATPSANNIELTVTR